MEKEYTFPPRRTSGVIGRLTLGQVTAVVIAIGLPWLGVQSGSIVAFALLLAAGGLLVWACFVRIGGRYVTEWARPASAAVWSRLWRSHVYRGAVFGPDSLAREMDLPGDLAGLRMLSAPNPDGRARVGLVLDERANTATAVLLTEGTPIILEESSEQAGRLVDWEAVMESTCEEDSAIARWQLLFRSMPDATNLAQEYYLDRVTDREWLPAQVLRELVSTAAPTAQRHEVFFAVAFDLHRLASEIKATGGDDEAIGVVVVERLADLQRQITEARIPVRGWLSPSHLAAVIHTQFDPDSLPLYDMQSAAKHELDPRTAGPSATERQWQAYVHDSAVSSTVWVHELPRRPVKANWLAPLLQQSDVRRSISLVVEPLPPSRAERSINNQRLAAAGSIYMKQRHGLVVDARTEKEYAAAQQLDDELSDGAGYFRYSMFVCVTAPDMDRLRRAVSSVRRRLTRIRCSTMVLYGEQDQAFFAAALPLARGLSPMRGLTGS
ncbi:SCO6880 family protein [Actinokineospora sp. UTMC 2448]|uniref:SCO6880 family protein n=1 Tax=Actinokineospora sp. UTMC 2448 TaxID=2268449 RepID=UPI0021641BFF|nr:SCO6880 family protein [Actinokineospora sp. UTMC 2448]UVS80581.1 Type IV secretory pathway, VirB4 component [Actinokineospora sp. UTMC 2448]